MKKLLLASLVFLSACMDTSEPNTDPAAVKAYRQAAREMSIAALKSIQARSIAEKAEYCGDIYEVNGKLVQSEIVKGRTGSCSPPEKPEGYVHLTSFHTHSNHSPRYANEVPSPTDLRLITFYGVYGYVSTPGGRLWEIDPFTKTASQICSAPCMQQDPVYDTSDFPPVPQSFTKSSLMNYILDFSEMD